MESNLGSGTKKVFITCTGQLNQALPLTTYPSTAHRSLSLQGDSSFRSLTWVSLCCSPAFNMCLPRPHYVPGPMRVWDGGWSVEYTDIRYRQHLREEISLSPFLQNAVTHSRQVEEIRHLLFLQPYLIILRESWSTGHFTFNEAQPEKTRCCQCTGQGRAWDNVGAQERAGCLTQLAGKGDRNRESGL